MRSKTKFLLLLTFLAFSLVIAFLSSYLGLDQNSLEKFISLNYLLASFVYTISFTVLTSFSFSSTVLTTIGTLLFSKYEIIPYALIGIMGSAVIQFYISRKLGLEYVKNHIIKKGGKIEAFDNILEKNPFKTIFILSVIFIVPPTIPNFLGGVLKINLRKYALATFLGNLPNTILTVFAVEGFLEANNLQVYLSIAGIILISLVGMYFYTGELKEIFQMSFPWLYKKKR